MVKLNMKVYFHKIYLFISKTKEFYPWMTFPKNFHSMFTVHKAVLANFWCNDEGGC